MQPPLELIEEKAPYVYGVMGAIWLVLAVYVGSALLLWPVAALAAGGALMLYFPLNRVTQAWKLASAFMGFVLSGYQAYVAVPLLTGEFSMIAAASLVVFVVFCLAHIVVAYAGWEWSPEPAK